MIGYAYETIAGMLRSVGLDDLIPVANRLFQDGATEDEIVVALEQEQAYQRRFRAVFERRAAGLPPISARDVLDYERTTAQLASFYGIPTGMFDPQDLLVADVSARELESRIAGAAADFQQASADPLYAQVLGELRGAGATEGELVAYFLDPDRAMPEIERRTAAARTLTAARRNDVDLTADMAFRYGERIANPEEAFGRVAQMRELTRPLDGGEDEIGQDTVLEAAAGNAAAQRTLAERASRRAAMFAGGGELATNREGVIGAGSA
jgi:hypothetical protein